MIEIYSWLLIHWDEIVQVYIGLVGTASIIVKLTPTLRDDHALKEVIRFIGRYVALNR